MCQKNLGESLMQKYWKDKIWQLEMWQARHKREIRDWKFIIGGYAVLMMFALVASLDALMGNT
jgi:hypothetical protein